MTQAVALKIGASCWIGTEMSSGPNQARRLLRSNQRLPPAVYQRRTTASFLPPSTASDPPKAQENSGTSIRAKARIGAGVAVAVIVILALNFALVRYRRRLRRLDQMRPGQHLPTQQTNGHIDEKVVTGWQTGPNRPPTESYYAPEMDSPVVHEMSGQSSRKIYEQLERSMVA
jgi:hypothetical protein